MKAIPVSPELRRGRNQLAALVSTGHAIKHIYNSGLQAILFPEIKLGLGLTATQLGSLAAARQVTGWFTTMGAGYLGDRFASRASLMLGISLSLMGVSFFLAGNASSYWVMFAAMLVVGLGPSLYHPPAIGALSRRFPDRRGFAISLHGTGGSAGEVLGPLVAAGALTYFVWQDVLRISLVPALLAAFVIWSMMRSVPGEAPGSASTRAYLASLVALVKKRALFALVMIAAMRSMGQSAVVTFLPVYLREDLEFSATRVAIYLSLAQVVGIGVQPVMGFLSDRYGRKAVLALQALLFLGLYYADPGAQLVLVILALGAVLYSLHTIFIAAAMDVAGGEVQSTVVSLIYGATFLGTVSPILAGLIVDQTGDTSNAFIYGGVVMFLTAAALASVRLPRTERQVAEGGTH